jgi:hypothetical protein
MNLHFSQPPNRAPLHGLALIELMVALTIGMVLALGILILMSSTSRSYKISDDYARMQENGTSAVRYMSDDLHMAGFFGMAGTTDALQTFDVNPADGNIDYGQDAGINWGTSAANDCGAANWSLQPAIPISGLPPNTPGGATPNDPISGAALSCIPAANYVAGPALIVRGAIGTMVNGVALNSGLTNNIPIKVPSNWTTAQFAPAGFDPNLLYIQSDPFLGFIFQGTNYDTYKNKTYTRSVPAIGGGFVDAPIYQYQAHIYYIRPCSRPAGPLVNGNPTCQGAGIDDQPNPTPIPTLVRQEWQVVGGVGKMMETGLVEGVEQMSIFYGYDTLAANGLPIPAGCNVPGQCTNSPDGVADSFSTVPPTAANSAQVVVVRVNLLVRSTAPTKSYDDSPKTYDLGGGTTWNCVVNNGPCNFKRHIFSQQIQLRNASVRRNG